MPALNELEAHAPVNVNVTLVAVLVVNRSADTPPEIFVVVLLMITSPAALNNNWVVTTGDDVAVTYAETGDGFAEAVAFINQLTA